MSRKYSNTNKIRFTAISERYAVKVCYKADLSKLYSKVILYVTDHFKNSNAFKQTVTYIINLITYSAYTGEYFDKWSLNSPFVEIPQVDEKDIEDALQDIYLTPDAIEWDVEPTDDPIIITNAESSDAGQVEVTTSTNSTNVIADIIAESKSKSHVTMKSNSAVSTMLKEDEPPTSKTDLYIQSPTVPQFDCNDIWFSCMDGADELVIYRTLPKIPTKQNEISCTTNVDQMTDAEVLKLFPNTIIRTRASIMYDRVDGLDYDSDLGVIFPIKDFTKEQIVDNIIRYPHLFKLQRLIDDEFKIFYTDYEVNGELRSIIDDWYNIPETKDIPYNKDYMKEYVVRRYLLERDIEHIEHKYPIYGSLNEFLTLFMPINDYKARGYTDSVQIGRTCVKSRVDYKITRNPIIRRARMSGALS